MNATKFTTILGIVALTLSFSTFGQTKPADPKLVECRAGNKQRDKELDEMFAAAKRQGKISGIESFQYKNIEKRIMERRAKLASDGFTLADCHAMTKEYESAKLEVEKMSAPAEIKPPVKPVDPPKKPVDPQVAECRAGNVKLDKEIDALFAKARLAGKVSVVENMRFKQLEKNIMARRAALSSDGFTLADCQAMTKEYESVKAEVTKMMM